jgi:hypothetical protein
VPLRALKVLLGHKHGDITRHHSAPELQELIEAAEPVCYDDFGNFGSNVVEEKSGQGIGPLTRIVQNFERRGHAAVR